MSLSTRLVFFRDWELSRWKIQVNWLEADGWNEWWRVSSGGQVFKGSFLAGIFFSTLGIFLDFPGIFSVLNAEFFLETWPLPLWWTGLSMPFIIHWLPLITPDVVQLGFTNLFSWHIWGWNHDAAADYAGVQFVKRALCMENDLHIDNALCVDIAPLLSQFDESTTLIDWLVLGVTHCETIFSNSCLKVNWT